MGVVDLAVSYTGNPPFMSYKSKDFVNMASCSYLGLDTHPHILQGAANAIYKAGALHLTTPRYKLFINMLAETELGLTQHFQNEAIVYISCAAATSAFLPLYSSGVLTDGRKPFMIFDKRAHFSIHHVKPICADETEIVVASHSDLNYIEEMCKQHKQVAYMAEGVYSIDGVCPIKELLQLQDKYGLFLYFDDSHGLSVIGDKGEGFILKNIGGKLNDKTIVVGSLAKAFGACGGVLLTGSNQLKEKLIRYGNSWSQYVNSAGLGGIMASLELHRTNEFVNRQNAWKQNLIYIDNEFPMLSNNGLVSPTRVLPTKTQEEAISFAKILFDLGYYVSPVFFPTVPRNSPGIRFMPRGDMSEEIIKKFCKILSLTQDSLVSP